MAIKKAVKTLKPEKAVKAIKAVRVPAASRMPVSETNLRKAAARLLAPRRERCSTDRLCRR